ncbi:CDP-glycerol glycerophosphotransferase family protein [Enterococcus gallinarum]|uniref:CDP-glycerol glycerophosphotransferase family protein n=1 Tax=Enterococcus TaxID=1350 RepID=UPI001C610AA9|nr:CDP-glycerol glycerophosphotransferase family protein [Enterococcus gallinarum]MBW5473400.1 hypothetical protein [Enterococcus gallinarum]MCO5476145.1 CDP-glycerol glycerophosphotransferase family protein [Enterococcus gallinarum]UJA23552.1 hypothetical protein HED61_08285 [Enterococcus gallinarum]
MHKIEIRTEKDECYFISRTFNFVKLVIAKGKNEIRFIKVDDFTWKITGKDIASLMKEKQEDRVFIYYGIKKEQISVDDFDISFINSPKMKIYNTEIYIYLTLDNKIRFIWNQFPSAKSYIQNAQITDIRMQKKQNLILNFQVVTKCIPIDKLNIVTINRQKQATHTIETKYINSRKGENSTFINSFSVTYDIVEAIKKVTGTIHYDQYNYDVIDFGFTIQSKIIPLTSYMAQISIPSIKNNEIWLNFSESKKIMIRFFENAKNKVSARFGILNNEEFTFLKSLENDHMLSKSSDKNNIILIMEYPHKAQENGLAFFKYLMDKQKEFIPYYIITKDSKDLLELNKYMSNVLFYKSKEHIEKLFQASYLAHTHTPNYAAPVLTSTIERKIKSFYNIFLQHGIIGVRNLEYMYGKKTNPELINKFVVSSKREFNIVRDELYYPEGDIILTGLPRFDYLLEPFNQVKTIINKKKILIMPSWRKGQENLSDEEFKKTSFFKAFNSLINNWFFENEVNKRDLTVNLYLHNNFQKYNHLFESRFVQVVEAGEHTVQNMLKNHGILITDYSSVGLDFSILYKPVLYYQFDNQLVEQRNFDPLEPDFLPGKIVNKEEELLNELFKKIEHYKMEKEFKKIVKNDIYQFRDRRACQRVFQNLQHLHEEKKSF